MFISSGHSLKVEGGGGEGGGGIGLGGGGLEGEGGQQAAMFPYTPPP